MGVKPEKEITMDARLNFLGNPVSAKFIKHVNAASAAVMNSGLPAATAALVEIRASQIALINAYNRMNVIVQQPAGDYQPGMFG